MVNALVPCFLILMTEAMISMPLQMGSILASSALLIGLMKRYDGPQHFCFYFFAQWLLSWLWMAFLWVMMMAGKTIIFQLMHISEITLTPLEALWQIDPIKLT